MATVPDVFIIETLAPDDEGNGRFEGSVISSVLRLHEKNQYTAMSGHEISSSKPLQSSGSRDIGTCTSQLTETNMDYLLPIRMR